MRLFNIFPTLSVSHLRNEADAYSESVGPNLQRGFVAADSPHEAGVQPDIIGVSGVLQRGDRQKVIWVDASSHLAKVMNLVTLRDGADLQFVHGSMGRDVPSVQKDSSVPMAVSVLSFLHSANPRPKVARGRISEISFFPMTVFLLLFSQRGADMLGRVLSGFSAPTQAERYSFHRVASLLEVALRGWRTWNPLAPFYPYPLNDNSRGR